MATLIITRHQVRDYDSWRPGFDSHEPARRAATIMNPRVYRNVDNPNDLTLTFDVADPDAASDFLESDDLRDKMKEVGVIERGQVHLID